MTTRAPARLTINVSSDFRDELKIQAITHGKTLKDYVVDTLMERIQQDSMVEHRVWGEMSEEAKKAGLVSTRDAESLLTRMKNA